MPETSFSFEPSDIVSRVMSLGSPTPIEVAVSGPNFAESRVHAEKIRQHALDDELARFALRIDGTREIHLGRAAHGDARLEHVRTEFHLPPILFYIRAGAVDL